MLTVLFQNSHVYKMDIRINAVNVFHFVSSQIGQSDGIGNTQLLMFKNNRKKKR